LAGVALAFGWDRPLNLAWLAVFLILLKVGDARPQTVATVSTWVGFATMCLGMFMAILDVQVVATSLPTIQGALSIAPDQMSWIQTAYLIAEVIAIPLTGFLTRTLSMRWLFVGAVVLFTLASIGCAASGSFQTLISWRVVQGFAGGTLIPAVFSAVFILFPPARQGIATTIGGVRPFWLRRLDPWSEVGSRRLIPGIGFFSSTSGRVPRAGQPSQAGPWLAHPARPRPDLSGDRT
jgi:Major Facilitator Superfamily